MRKSKLRIYLIRHARPLVSREGLFSKAQAEQYLKDYQVAEVEQILPQPGHLPLPQVKKVFCSTLPRAKATARMLFGEEVELVEDALFREFENRIWGLPWAKLPLSWWQVPSRILWFLGLNQREIESFRKAKARAAQAAEHLIAEATQNGVAVLVAHGFLNEFIKRALVKRGWQVRVNGGRGYVGITQLEK
ncbi:histidine phosphatase family protein [Rufibacter immobilis]|uniref:histidine phosphatase family protein n=1 Tax=Rufibacter immobilis TaxID=1348778 RepID=UPI0035E65096